MSERDGFSSEKGVSVARVAERPAALSQAGAVVVDGPAEHDAFRAVLDVLPAAVYTTDAAGRVTYYNPAAVELAGHAPVLGKAEWCVTWRLYNPDGTRLPHDQCPMAVALRENRAVRGVEAILERPDGTRIPFMPFPTPLRDAAGRLIGAVNLLIDVSDRKAADTARAYLAAIVESSDDGIVSKDLNGIIKTWNRGAEAIFGYPAEEVIGKPILILFPPDRLDEEDVILARIRRGEKIDHFETVRRHKDGRLIDVSLTISPVRDDSGRIVGVSKIARDITDRKRAEAMLRDLNDNLERRIAERTRELAETNERLLKEMAEHERTEAALQQSQKLEALGQLASGMAHDFNNLLAAVLGNLELLEMRLSDERLRKLVEAATRSARRGAQLNQQVLAFTRKQHLAPQSVDVNALILGLDELLRRTLGGTVQVATTIATDLWPALVDPHQLELVILNLAINARDAMPAGGRVLIESRNTPAPRGDRTIGLAPGDYVTISVADNGTGMTPEVLARACEPFFTTKEPGKGSGLGLAQVYGLVRQSGGGLRITSAPGKGTRVELFLPRAATRPDAAAGPAQPRPQLQPQQARLLVVDDHQDVREVIVAHLEALGYSVDAAASGHAALALVDRDPGGFDVLLADYAMPEMSGLELIRAVRARRPDLPVVIVTGYADASDLDRGLDRAFLLHKPFRMTELGGAIESALASSRRPIRLRPAASD